MCGPAMPAPDSRRHCDGGVYARPDVAAYGSRRELHVRSGSVDGAWAQAPRCPWSPPPKWSALPTVTAAASPLEHAEAIVAAADRVDKPIILQVSENAVRFHH